MTWGRAALCWLVAAAFGAIYVAGTPRHASELAMRDRDRPAASASPGDIPAPVQLVELRRGEDVVAWERREDGGWRVTAPAGRAIPAGLLDAFNEQLLAVGIGERFEGDANDPAFGFQHPTLRITVVGEDGRRVMLVVGDRTPTGTSAYARREGGDAVVLVGLNLLYYADLLFDAAR